MDWTKLAEQVPALMVLAWIVSVFIKDRREGSKQSAAAFAQRDETIKAIAKEHSDVSRECVASISESREVMRQCTATLAKANESRQWSGAERATKP